MITRDDHLKCSKSENFCFSPKQIFRGFFQLKVCFTVPELERNHIEYEEAIGDTEGEEGAWKNNRHLNVPGTPTETFRQRKNRSKSPTGDKNNMKHSASSASIDSVLKNENEDLSETESESEWHENNKGTNF